MRREVLLGALLVGAWLAVAPGCDPGGVPGDGGSDAGSDAGADAGGNDGGNDSGTISDGGIPDAGQDAGVPSCQGYAAPTVPLQVATACPGFTPCGGDPTGRWVYDGGCATNPFTSLVGSCPGGTISGASGTLNGCISFSGAVTGVVARQVSWTLTATADFPSTCVPAGCATLEGTVRNLFPGATCSSTVDGCACTVSTSDSVDDVTTYLVSGTEIIAGGVSYPFCVPTASVMQYRESGSSPVLPRGDLARR